MRTLAHVLADVLDDPALTTALVIAVVVAGFAAGNYLIRRAVDPGPLARGESRWRYRSHPLRERIAAPRLPLTPFHRTPGWWATRFEFAFAIAAAALPPLLVPGLMAPTFGDDSRMTALAILAVAEAAILVGIAWMVRIYRAPLRVDATATWRYRDGSS